MQRRNDKGLCFKCGEKYNFNHHCAFKEINLILVEEVVTGEGGETVIQEMDEWTEKREFNQLLGEEVEALMELSMYAAMGNNSHNTMRIDGKVKKNSISILIDSSSNFPSLMQDWLRSWD